MLSNVEAFLRRTQMPPTTFGRRAAGDPRLVFDMRMGRELRAKTSNKLTTFMAAWGDRLHARPKHYRPNPRRPGARLKIGN